MVGLSNYNAPEWTLKIIRLLMYPDFVHPTPPTRTGPWPIPRRLPLASVSDLALDRPTQVQGEEDTTSSCDDSESRCSSPEGVTCASSPISSDDELARKEEEVRLAAPTRRRRASAAAPTPHHYSPPRRRRRGDTNPPTSPHLRRPSQEARSIAALPFFSFTRTQDGTSLTTDTRSLAVLFPLEERHLLQCSDELVQMDREIQKKKVGVSVHEEEEEGSSATFSCLEVDLREFQLGESFHFDLESVG